MGMNTVTKRTSEEWSVMSRAEKNQIRGQWRNENRSWWRGFFWRALRLCGYEEKREAAPGGGGLFCFVFKDGSVFIVFEEDANKAEAREREVSGKVRPGRW